MKPQVKILLNLDQTEKIKPLYLINERAFSIIGQPYYKINGLIQLDFCAIYGLRAFLVALIMSPRELFKFYWGKFRNNTVDCWKW